MPVCEIEDLDGVVAGRLEIGVDVQSLESDVAVFVAYIRELPDLDVRLYIQNEVDGLVNWLILAQLLEQNTSKLRRVVLTQVESDQNAPSRDALDNEIRSLLPDIQRACERFEIRLVTNHTTIEDTELAGVRLTTHNYWTIPAAHHWADPRPWRNPAIQAFYIQR